LVTLVAIVVVVDVSECVKVSLRCCAVCSATGTLTFVFFVVFCLLFLVDADFTETVACGGGWGVCDGVVEIEEATTTGATLVSRLDLCGIHCLSNLSVAE
jgi:hypothetical protein